MEMDGDVLVIGSDFRFSFNFLSIIGLGHLLVVLMV